MTYEEILQAQPETPLYIIIPLILIPISTFIFFMFYFIKNKVEVFPNFSFPKLGYVLASLLISLIIALGLNIIASIWDTGKERVWKNESLVPFLEENVEIKESDSIHIVDYDYEENIADYTFVLDNGKTAQGKSEITFDLENDAKPFVEYRYNNEYTKHVSSDSFYEFDNSDVRFKEYYYGVYDVELHAPKDYLEDLPNK